MATATILDLLALGTPSPPTTCSFEIVNDTVFTDSPSGSSQRMTVAQLFQSPTIDTLKVTTSLEVTAPAPIGWTSAAQMWKGSADGVVKFTNAAGTGFTGFQLGGTTASFPALFIASTTVAIKLADNSGYAPLIASVVQGMTQVQAGSDISGGAAKLSASDGTTLSGISFARTLGVASSSGSAQTTGADIGALVMIKQTVATTGGPQALEGYSAATHTSGTVTLVLGTIGNAEVSGTGGTTTNARGLQGGGLVSNGTCTTFTSVQAASPGISGTGVIGTLIGLSVSNMTAGSTNYAIKTGSGQVSLGDDTVIGPASAKNLVVAAGGAQLATTATAGFLFLSSCNGNPTGVPAAIPSGTIPFFYDTSGNRLWAYNGSWRSVAVT